MTIPSQVPEKFQATTSVSLTVKDIQKSAAWYQGIVGFGIERTFERDGKLVLVALKAGHVRINLNQDDGAKGWDRIKGLGFSVNIWTTEDIDGIAKRIKTSGGTLDVIGSPIVTKLASRPYVAMTFRASSSQTSP